MGHGGKDEGVGVVRIMSVGSGTEVTIMLMGNVAVTGWWRWW